MNQEPHNKLSPRAIQTMNNDLERYKLIRDVLPKIVALSEDMQSDVLQMAAIILQRESMVLQSKWAGQV